MERKRRIPNRALNVAVGGVFLASALIPPGFSYEIQISSALGYHPSVELVGVARTQDGWNGFVWNNDGKEADDSLEKKALISHFIVGLLSDPKDIWVNMDIRGNDLSILSRQLYGTELGYVFMASDLQLKKDAANLLAQYISEEDLAELNATPRFWIEPAKVVIVNYDDGAMIKDFALRVRGEIKGDKGSLPIKEMESALTERVNTAPEYFALRQAIKAVALAQWMKRHGYDKEFLAKIRSGKGVRDELTVGRKDLTRWEAFTQYLLNYKSGKVELSDYEVVVGGITAEGEAEEENESGGIGKKIKSFVVPLITALGLGWLVGASPAKAQDVKEEVVPIQERLEDIPSAVQNTNLNPNTSFYQGPFGKAVKTFPEVTSLEVEANKLVAGYIPSEDQKFTLVSDDAQLILNVRGVTYYVVLPDIPRDLDLVNLGNGFVAATRKDRDWVGILNVKKLIEAAEKGIALDLNGDRELADEVLYQYKKLGLGKLLSKSGGKAFLFLREGQEYPELWISNPIGSNVVWVEEEREGGQSEIITIPSREGRKFLEAVPIDDETLLAVFYNDEGKYNLGLVRYQKPSPEIISLELLNDENGNPLQYDQVWIKTVMVNGKPALYGLATRGETLFATANGNYLEVNLPGVDLSRVREVTILDLDADRELNEVWFVTDEGVGFVDVDDQKAGFYKVVLPEDKRINYAVMRDRDMILFLMPKKPAPSVHYYETEAIVIPNVVLASRGEDVRNDYFLVKSELGMVPMGSFSGRRTKKMTVLQYNPQTAEFEAIGSLSSDEAMDLDTASLEGEFELTLSDGSRGLVKFLPDGTVELDLGDRSLTLYYQHSPRAGDIEVSANRNIPLAAKILRIHQQVSLVDWVNQHRLMMLDLYPQGPAPGSFFGAKADQVKVQVWDGERNAWMDIGTLATSEGVNYRKHLPSGLRMYGTTDDGKWFRITLRDGKAYLEVMDGSSKVEASGSYSYNPGTGILLLGLGVESPEEVEQAFVDGSLNELAKKMVGNPLLLGLLPLGFRRSDDLKDAIEKEGLPGVTEVIVKAREELKQKATIHYFRNNEGKLITSYVYREGLPVDAQSVEEALVETLERIGSPVADLVKASVNDDRKVVESIIKSLDEVQAEAKAEEIKGVLDKVDDLAYPLHRVIALTYGLLGLGFTGKDGDVQKALAEALVLAEVNLAMARDRQSEEVKGLAKVVDSIKEVVGYAQAGVERPNEMGGINVNLLRVQ